MAVAVGPIANCGGGDTPELGPRWVPTDVLVADVDGDGRNDVVTLAMFKPTGYGSEEGVFFVYLQTGTPGVFAAPVRYSTGRYPWHAALVDVDGDARPDLVLADPSAKTVWLVRQDGAQPGRFLAAEPLITGVNTYTAVVADFNNDGAPDVATDEGLCSSNRVLIRYQDPLVRGTFGPPTGLDLPNIPTEIAAGDLDGDGLDDLLITVKDACPPAFVRWNAGYVVAYQKPGGGFELSGPHAMQPSACNVYRLAIADLNADGRQDFFAFETPSFPACPPRLASVLQTATPRSFAAPVYTSLAAIDGNNDATLADLDQDGLPDAGLVGFWPEPGGPYAAPIVRSRANLMTSNGAGTFTLASSMPLPFSSSRLGAGDLNGDRANDLLVLDDARAEVMFQSAPGVFLPPRALH